MDTPKLDLLSRAMHAYSMRLQAVSSNIANLDTPDYRRVSVSFEEQLQQAGGRIDEADELGRVQPRAEVEDSPAQLETELMELSDTQMRVQLAARALREHFDLMRNGITGRTM